MAFNPKVPLALEKGTRGEVVDFLEKVDQCERWPQPFSTTMFFLTPIECDERASHCAHAHDYSLVRRPPRARGCEVASKMPY